MAAKKMAKEAIAARNRKASPQPKPKAMPIFEVRWCESLRHITRVQADSEEEARELVMAGEFEARDDMVIDDSFEGITSVKKAE